MFILAIVAGTILIVFIIGKINLSIRFRKSVKLLFALAKPIQGKKYSYAQLDGLPSPVQRYFKYVLKEQQPYISFVSLLHERKFKTGKGRGWVDIKGEQYFSIEKPGFIWKGSTALFVARDLYIAGKGRLIVSLLSLYNVVNGQGETFDQGELLRWLAENVWFPTNLLPSDQLKWLAVDDNTAKLSFTFNKMSLFYIVTFNELGEIIQMETKRFMEDRLETWIGKMGNYQRINGVGVPTNIEAIWRLEEGDLSYAKFNVTKIIYDHPQLLH
ncbi:MAG: DUF6544 family protein [Pedobacter sp.]